LLSLCSPSALSFHAMLVRCWCDAGAMHRHAVGFVAQSFSSRSVVIVAQCCHCRAVVIVAQSRSCARPVVSVVPSRHRDRWHSLRRRPAVAPSESPRRALRRPRRCRAVVIIASSRRRCPARLLLCESHRRAVVPSHRSCNVEPLSSSRHHTVTRLSRRAVASSEFRRHAVVASESLRRAVVLLHHQRRAFRVAPSRSE
jgi:hypothetical protein